MGQLFQEKKGSFFLLTILFFILTIIIYFILVNPLKDNLKREQSNLTTLEAEVEILQAQVSNIEQQEERIAELGKQVPLGPNVNKFLDQLQSLEKSSGVTINDVNFGYGDTFAGTDASAPVEDDIAATEEMEEGIETEDVALTTGGVAPANLNQITASISGSAPGHQDFMKFLKGLEKLERIAIVDNVQFSTGEEDLSFSLELATFYYNE